MGCCLSADINASTMVGYQPQICKQCEGESVLSGGKLGHDTNAFMNAFVLLLTSIKFAKSHTCTYPVGFNGFRAPREPKPFSGQVHLAAKGSAGSRLESNRC